MGEVSGCGRPILVWCKPGVMFIVNYKTASIIWNECTNNLEKNETSKCKEAIEYNQEMSISQTETNQWHSEEEAQNIDSHTIGRR